MDFLSLFELIFGEWPAPFSMGFGVEPAGRFWGLDWGLGFGHGVWGLGTRDLGFGSGVWTWDLGFGSGVWGFMGMLNVGIKPTL